MGRFIVYCHTNRVNGKRYVGWAKLYGLQVGSDGLLRRWKQHVKLAQRINSKRYLFHYVIKKHGVDAWRHEVLDVLSTLEGVKHAEVLWIKQRNSYAFGGHGYNMTKGGDGAVGMRGYRHKPGARLAISHGNTGKRRTPEMKLQTSVATKAAMTPEVCETICLRTREALADPEVRTRMETNNYDKRRKRVQQLAMDGTLVAAFLSANQASRETGVNLGNLTACARGLFKQAGGFMWRYA